MNAGYPDFKKYRQLYARYLKSGTGDLMRLAKPLRGTHVLDLCGGDGRLTLEALNNGAAHVTLVDSTEAMVPSEVSENPGVEFFPFHVLHFLFFAAMRDMTFDRVLCQQAVNYWLDCTSAELVARLLKPGGMFVFNTFHQRPSEKPRVREYEMDGHSFAETSWLVGNIVHHLQVRNGLEHHYTSFKWLSPEDLRTMLEPRFLVNEEQRGASSLYQCVKK